MELEAVAISTRGDAAEARNWNATRLERHGLAVAKVELEALELGSAGDEEIRVGMVTAGDDATVEERETVGGRVLDEVEPMEGIHDSRVVDALNRLANLDKGRRGKGEREDEANRKGKLPS